MHISYRKLLLLTLMILCQKVYSQDIENLYFKTYTSADGLSDGVIQDIFEDSKGFIWIATLNGVNRFDGYTFKNYYSDTKDSTTISHRQTKNITEDKFGNLWFATNLGICFYNPDFDNFIRVRLFLKNGEEISSFSMASLMFDQDGSLWAFSDSVLYQIPPPHKEIGANQKITVIEKYSADQVFRSEKNIFETMTMDGNGNIWFASFKNLLAVYKKNQKSFEPVKIELTNSDDINYHDKKYLTYDPYNDAILIGASNRGLVSYNISTKEFKSFNQSNTPGFYNNLYKPFVESKDKVWLPSDGKGLYIFNQNDKSLINIDNDGNYPFSISTHSIKVIFRDRKGNTWLGASDNNGINMYSPYSNKFRQNSRNINSTNTLSSDNVTGFFQDSDDNLWICTDGGGLNMLDKNGKYSVIKAGPKSFPSNKIVSTVGDKNGNIWIAAWDGGISRLKPKISAIYNHLDHCPPQEKELYKWPYRLLNDSHDNLWIAFMGSGLGYYNKKTNDIFTYSNSKTSNNEFIDNYVSHIYEDNLQNIWICTYNGLSYFNLEETDFSVSPPKINFNHLFHDPKGISSNEISAIVQDANGIYWIGHMNHGLDRMDLKTNSFTNFTVKDGLPGNSIKGIIYDQEHSLWIFTDKGLLNLDLNDSTTKYYDALDGMMGPSISSAPYINRHGEIFFGFINGYNSFHPKKMVLNPHKPKVHITGLKMYNEEVSVGQEFGGQTILPKMISELDEIFIGYKDDYITINYLAIDYSRPEKIRYKYMLEGFDRQWIEAGNKREAVYMNLNPGTYTFKVIAANNDGLWNENPSTLRIRILPPWWQKWWFKPLLTLLIIVVLWSLYRQRISVLKRQKKLLEQKVGERTLELQEANEKLNEKQEEILAQNEELVIQKKEIEVLSDTKVRFFMNVTHEFRTPITIILGILEVLNSELKEKKYNTHLALLDRNTKRLLRLINQLLDLRHLETSAIKLQVSKKDLVVFVKEIFESFEYMAIRHKIHYIFSSNLSSYNTFFEPDIIEKVLYNIISNAFKFTPEGKSIILDLEKSEIGNNDRLFPKGFKRKDRLEIITIKITDEGFGISDDVLPKVFERFYKDDTYSTKRISGTGIGLSLAKGLIELHNGEISIQSRINEGTQVTIRWISDIAIYSQEKISYSMSGLLIDKYPHITIQSIESMSDGISTPDDISMDNKPVILIADDNLDILKFMQIALGECYTIHTATNGKDALNKAIEILPEVVVSDIMMPEIDGIELCKKLKTEPQTSHIPVIILTAKTEEGAQITGFTYGADDYIIKPFNIEILKARIRNLIESRKQLKERFSKDIDSSIDEMIAKSGDTDMLKKIIELINQNINNPDLTNNMLADLLNMSRSNFYRKVKSISGLPVNEFIRTVRLKKAAQLIRNSDANISEISYQLGFNTPQYFTKCFKDQFGISPSEFKKQLENLI